MEEKKLIADADVRKANERAWEEREAKRIADLYAGARERVEKAEEDGGTADARDVEIVRRSALSAAERMAEDAETMRRNEDRFRRLFGDIEFYLSNTPKTKQRYKRTTLIFLSGERAEKFSQVCESVRAAMAKKEEETEEK